MLKFYLIDGDGKRTPATKPFREADFATVPGACPLCKAEPFKIAGSGKHIAPNDRAYEAPAVSWCCRKRVGTLRAEPATLFGLHEDEQLQAIVASMGIRVY